MRIVLLTAALAAIFMLSGPASAEARGPYRHRGWHHRSYVTATVPSYRTVRVERTTTIIQTSRQERKLMALAYIKKNGYLTVSNIADLQGWTANSQRRNWTRSHWTGKIRFLGQ